MATRRKRQSRGADSRLPPELTIVPPPPSWTPQTLPQPTQRRGGIQHTFSQSILLLPQSGVEENAVSVLSLAGTASSAVFGPNSLQGSSATHSDRVEVPVVPPLRAGHTAADSEEFLFAQTHERRVALEKIQQAKTSTGETYKRHVNNYFAFWEREQDNFMRQNPNWARVPALPINATKVAMFIEYEMKREKRKRKSADGDAEYRTGTSLGVQSILLAVSALEKERFMNAHQYRNDPLAQIPLRNDPRIKSLESAAKHNEAARVDSSQKLKAAGTTADTYTTDELHRLSRYLITHPNSKAQLIIAIRDRAMLLMSSQMAFRGEVLRDLLLSDLFTASAPNYKAGENKVFELLAILSDHGKTNQNGRVDEHGAIRHKHADLCCIGGLALWLFTLFHCDIGAEPLPNFAPDFSPAAQTAGFGEFGRRGWYRLHVFKPSTGNCEQQMSYSNHYDRVVSMNRANNISITKVTHAGRAKAAQTARLHGASVADTKAMGGWNETGSFRSCYDRTHPIGAMLGAAHHVAERPEAFFIGRSALDPPAELQSQVFPWIEEQQAAMDARANAHNPSKDIALREFLLTLRWFRTVLLQDMAALYDANSHCSIFTYSPFNTDIFRAFASGAAARISDAERAVRLRLAHLPEHLTAAVGSILSDMSVKQAEEQAETRRVMQRLGAQTEQLSSQLATQSAVSEPDTAALRRSRGARVPLATASRTSLSPLAYPSVSQTRGTPGYDSMGPSFNQTKSTLNALPASNNFALTFSGPLHAFSSTPPASNRTPTACSESLRTFSNGLPASSNMPSGFGDTSPAFDAASPALSGTPPTLNPTPPALNATPPMLNATPALDSMQHALNHAQPAFSVVRPVPNTPTVLIGFPGFDKVSQPFNGAQHALDSAACAPALDDMPHAHVLPGMPAFNGLPPAVLPMPPYDASLKPLHIDLVEDWKRICQRYEHTKIAAHTWFVDAARRRWIPSYSFSADTLLASVWREWHEGLDGKFSIEALTDGWDCAWRENAKSVYSKRLRVINFIRQLKKERHWSIEQAIRFIDTTGAGATRCTALYSQLTQKGKETALLASAKKHKF